MASGAAVLSGLWETYGRSFLVLNPAKCLRIRHHAGQEERYDTTYCITNGSGIWNYFGRPELENVTEFGGSSVTASQAVAKHLPFLRRYARVLTGSQQSGDSYVAATLETLIEDPSVLGTTMESRVGLYRLFTKVWNTVPNNGVRTPLERDAPAAEHLANMTPRPRQAFLLVSLEGFSEEEAAKILETDVLTIRALVEESGRELAHEIATDVLIIEDEAFIALDLEGLVESLGHQTIGVARTHSEAIKLAKNKKPGLILADIQLADGSSGLEAVNELLRSLDVPVIFITAFPERFLTGQRPEPAYLIAKPYQAATISAVISQALFFERKARHPQRSGKA